jgi:D-alanyl-D-alanine carboxypeptidase
MRHRRVLVLGLAAATATLAACGGPARAPSPAATSTSTGERIEATTTTGQPISIAALLATERRWYPAPGALAIARLGTGTWSGQSGAADLAGTPITDSTRFRIASITKPIVAALVLDAVERGQVSLDDEVGDLLPGVVRPGPPVTVRMLLDHTSGIFDEGNEGDPVADVEQLTDGTLRAEAADLSQRYAAGEQVIASDRLLVALAETHDRYFGPGEGYHYSNVNYQLAAMVLQEATGATVDELLRSRITEPLGLLHTTIAPPDVASPELRGYLTSSTDGSLTDVTDDLVAFGNGGNGGIISTADELLTILQAIVSGELVGDELVADMRSPTSQSADSYGLGLATYHLTCGTFHGHEGNVNGTASIGIVSAAGTDGTVIALNLGNGEDPMLPVLADQLLCDHLGA